MKVVVNKVLHGAIVAVVDAEGYSVFNSLDGATTVPAKYQPEVLSRAHLFAAAPELLEALEEFIICGPNAGHNQDLIEQVKSAIAKARGGA